MEHKDKVITTLESLKSQASEAAIKLVEEVSPINLSEVQRILKPFGDIESQIDRSIKFIQGSGSIPKKSSLSINSK